jgi:hypothetical protein
MWGVLAADFIPILQQMNSYIATGNFRFWEGGGWGHGWFVGGERNVRF